MTSLSRRVQRAAETAASTAQDAADVIGRNPGRVTVLLVGSSVVAWAVTYVVVTRGQAAARAAAGTEPDADGAPSTDDADGSTDDEDRPAEG